MLEIGKTANDEFVSRNLGPRAPLETLFEESETQEESAAKWIANCKMMCEQPKLEPNFDLAKAQAQQESERAEVMKQWRARLDWQAGKAEEAIRDHHVDVLHEAAEGDESDDSPRWVNERIAEGYTVPRGGFLARSVPIVKARLLAKLQSGQDREAALTELREEYGETMVEVAIAA